MLYELQLQVAKEPFGVQIVVEVTTLVNTLAHILSQRC
jgi:hypothetical protein